MKPKKRASGPSGPSVPQALRKGTRIEIRVSDELATTIEEHSETHGLTKKEVVIEALRQFFR